MTNAGTCMMAFAMAPGGLCTCTTAMGQFVGVAR
jgi:hypothetical protein